MTAIISTCGKYRYLLRRKTDVPLRWVKRCLFIMLNPSTADADNDDPTIRKCIKFAKREGCTDLAVVNLFALRSTDPNELLRHPDVWGDNNWHLRQAIEDHRYGLIICAWGSHKAVSIANKKFLSELLGNVDAKCFHINKDGNPKHPLYVRNDAELIEYKIAR